MPDPVSAVLFDLDNTLADRDVAFLSWARWLAGERLGFTDEAMREEVVATIVDLDHSGHTPKDALFHALKERYVALTEPVDVLVVAFREQLLTQLPPLDSSTTDLLAALDDVGVPWGIVSNGSRSQRNKIRKLGLEGRTNCIVISEAVGVRKPDPAIFHLAAERLLVHPAATLFVGDHPDADIVGAAGAGMRTAWLHRGREWPARLASSHPHYTIDTLTDLYQVVIDR